MSNDTKLAMGLLGFGKETSDTAKAVPRGGLVKFAVTLVSWSNLNKSMQICYHRILRLMSIRKIPNLLWVYRHLGKKLAIQLMPSPMGI